MHRGTPGQCPDQCGIVSCGVGGVAKLQQMENSTFQRIVLAQLEFLVSLHFHPEDLCVCTCTITSKCRYYSIRTESPPKLRSNNHSGDEFLVLSFSSRANIREFLIVVSRRKLDPSGLVLEPFETSIRHQAAHRILRIRLCLRGKECENL